MNGLAVALSHPMGGLHQENEERKKKCLERGTWRRRRSSKDDLFGPECGGTCTAMNAGNAAQPKHRLSGSRNHTA